MERLKLWLNSKLNRQNTALNFKENFLVNFDQHNIGSKAERPREQKERQKAILDNTKLKNDSLGLTDKTPEDLVAKEIIAKKKHQAENNSEAPIPKSPSAKFSI